MRVADIILEQLGGNKFIVMTGSKNLVSDKNTLRMTLAKNMSKANRLEIILQPDDLYTMRFYRYIAPRMNSKTLTFSKEKITEVAKYEGVFFDKLQEIFTQVTGMNTHL